MADLTEAQSSQFVRIVGADVNSNPTLYANVTANGLQVDPSSVTDKNITGTISALNGTVLINTNGCSALVLTTTGTWAGILSFEGFDGTNWIAASGMTLPLGGITTAFSGNGSIVINCGGFSQVRVRASTFTSGTANIFMNAGTGSSIVEVYNNTAANFNAQVRSQDGSGNPITSSQQIGTAANKQALDVAVVSLASGYYSAPVNIRQTAATAASATVWSMRNAAASTKTVYIERLELLLAFDSATPATRATLRYDLVRYSGATPTLGTAITVVPMDSSSSATQVTDVRFLDTGLTTTGVTFGTPIATISCPATDATTTKFQRNKIAIKLAPGEGLCLRLNVAAVIGQSVTGEVTWSEK